MKHEDRTAEYWSEFFADSTLRCFSHSAPIDKLSTLLRRVASDVSRLERPNTIVDVIVEISRPLDEVKATVFFSLNIESEARGASQGDPASAYNLGLILHDSGRLIEAAEAYRKAIEFGSVSALGALAELLIDDGDVDEARSLLTRAVELGDPWAEESLAEIADFT